jgi:Ca2+/H+ antiporter, TMEM165/GDT1 family
VAASFLDGFVLVFAVIGGLELIDRTSLTLIAMASRGHPGATWLGGAIAFVLTTGIAVTIGAALAAVLGPGRIGLLRAGGGAFLIGYAIWLYLGPEEEPEIARHARSALYAALLTIFLLELGDTTMIFEIVFVSSVGPWVVFAAGASALVAVAAWDVKLGERLGAKLPARQLNRVVVAVLLVVGALTIAYGLDPGLFASFPALASG